MKKEVKRYKFVINKIVDERIVAYCKDLDFEKTFIMQEFSEKDVCKIEVGSEFVYQEFLDVSADRTLRCWEIIFEEELQETTENLELLMLLCKQYVDFINSPSYYSGGEVVKMLRESIFEIAVEMFYSKNIWNKLINKEKK